MKVSEIFKTVQNIERLRGVLSSDNYDLTRSEINEIRDMLWYYQQELLEKEVKWKEIFMDNYYVLQNGNNYLVYDELVAFETEDFWKSYKIWHKNGHNSPSIYARTVWIAIWI